MGESYGTLFYYQNTGSSTAPAYTQQTGTANPFDGIDVGFSSTPPSRIWMGMATWMRSWVNLTALSSTTKTPRVAPPLPILSKPAPRTPSMALLLGSPAPTLADLDGDGDLDAIVGERDGTLFYYQNTGSSTTPAYTEQTGTANPFDGIDVGYDSAPTFADLDGDGDLDAIVGESDGTLFYYLSVTSNLAPTAVAFDNAVTTIAENTDTTDRIKVADVNITDDGQGTNTLSLSGDDAASFEVDATGLYLKAGTILDFETQSSYAVTVQVTSK